jgi:hypothetical protein
MEALMRFSDKITVTGMAADGCAVGAEDEPGAGGCDESACVPACAGATDGAAEADGPARRGLQAAIASAIAEVRQNKTSFFIRTLLSDELYAPDVRTESTLIST